MMRKAIINIFSSYNNVLMTATDLTGAETIATCSGGQVVKSSKDSGGQFAATRAAERMADQLKEKEFTQVIVKYPRTWWKQVQQHRSWRSSSNQSSNPCRSNRYSN